MVVAIGATEAAKRLYGDSGTWGVQAGRRNIYNWLDGGKVPNLQSRVLIVRALARFERADHEENGAF